MATDLALDDSLVEEARRIGRHRSKREAVNCALEEYIARRRRRKILDLFGKLDWDGDCDPKKGRKRR
jgi:Arc/MetJ family transcription regulator